MTDEPDRVRRHTADAVLSRIDDETRANLMRYAGADRDQTDARLRELEREWDTDRVIEAEGAVTALAGLALTFLAHRRFVAIPILAAASIFLHATTGWHPLLPIFRRLGVRSGPEIQRERYALKVLRGDFENLESANASEAANRSSSAIPGSSQATRADLAAQLRGKPEYH